MPENTLIRVSRKTMELFASHGASWDEALSEAETPKGDMPKYITTELDEPYGNGFIIPVGEEMLEYIQEEMVFDDSGEFAEPIDDVVYRILLRNSNVN